MFPSALPDVPILDRSFTADRAAEVLGQSADFRKLLLGCGPSATAMEEHARAVRAPGPATGTWRAVVIRAGVVFPFLAWPLSLTSADHVVSDALLFVPQGGKTPATTRSGPIVVPARPTST